MQGATDTCRRLGGDDIKGRIDNCRLLLMAAGRHGVISFKGSSDLLSIFREFVDDGWGSFRGQQKAVGWLEGDGVGVGCPDEWLVVGKVTLSGHKVASQ